VLKAKQFDIFETMYVFKQERGFFRRRKKIQEYEAEASG